MKALSARQLKGLFWAIEINLLIWMAASGWIWWTPAVPRHIKYIVTAGLIVAALLQHWAYYNLYKRAKEMGGRTSG